MLHESIHADEPDEALIENGRAKPPGRRATIRKKIVTKDMGKDKFKALVHFLIHENRDPDRLGAVRLNKTLWYADVVSYHVNGAAITDETYRKRRSGPVPGGIRRILGELEEEGKIAVREPQYPYETRKFLSLRAPDANALSEGERHLALSALDAVLDYAANAISEIPLDDVWRMAHEGEEIPLAATLGTTQGEITPEVLSWAKTV